MFLAHPSMSDDIVEHPRNGMVVWTRVHKLQVVVVSRFTAGWMGFFDFTKTTNKN